MLYCFFFFSSRRRHTRYWRDWSSDVCSSDLSSSACKRSLIPRISRNRTNSRKPWKRCTTRWWPRKKRCRCRSEEHTSELQSRQYLVCRLLLEKKKTEISITTRRSAARVEHKT